jgi:hypothetical protein
MSRPGISDDPVPGQVAAAIRHALEGDREAGAAALAAINQDSLRKKRLAAFTAAGRRQASFQAPPTPPTMTQRDPTKGYLNEDVFVRDSFACRYCLKLTIHLPVLQALSRAFPAVFPYDAHWKFGSAHMVYWTHSASWDHLVAKKRGGGDEWDNIMTACYQCQQIKSDRLLAELGWPIQDAASDWDGLTSYYNRLLPLNLSPSDKGTVSLLPEKPPPGNRSRAGRVHEERIGGDGRSYCGMMADSGYAKAHQDNAPTCLQCAELARRTGLG